jgi:hypothetical protein
MLEEVAVLRCDHRLPYVGRQPLRIDGKPTLLPCVNADQLAVTVEDFGGRWQLDLAG